MWTPLSNCTMTEKGIHTFFITFLNSFTIHCSTSNLATYQEKALGSTNYHRQDGGITYTGITLVLLYRGSMIDERDSSIYYRNTGQFVHELHYFKVGITQKRH
jgi:hypothetical protein